jgi:integral membrane protein
MKSSFSLFRKIAFFEGISFLAIFITMILKYGFKIPEPNYFVGMVHGLLFVAYAVIGAYFAFSLKWNVRAWVITILASLLPFGTFWADKHLFKLEEEKL